MDCKKRVHTSVVADTLEGLHLCLSLLREQFKNYSLPAQTKQSRGTCCKIVQAKWGHIQYYYYYHYFIIIIIFIVIIYMYIFIPMCEACLTRTRPPFLRTNGTLLALLFQATQETWEGKLLAFLAQGSTAVV